MLDLETRGAILRLAREGHGTRFIARAVRVARKSVQRVVASGQTEVPEPERADQLSAHIVQVRELVLACKGNDVGLPACR